MIEWIQMMGYPAYPGYLTSFSEKKGKSIHLTIELEGPFYMFRARGDGHRFIEVKQFRSIQEAKDYAAAHYDIL